MLLRHFVAGIVAVVSLPARESSMVLALHINQLDASNNDSLIGFAQTDGKAPDCEKLDLAA